MVKIGPLTDLMKSSLGKTTQTVDGTYVYVVNVKSGKVDEVEQASLSAASAFGAAAASGASGAAAAAAAGGVSASGAAASASGAAVGTGTPQPPPPPECPPCKPMFELKKWGYSSQQYLWCNMCGKWYDENHVLSVQHVKRAADPVPYLMYREA